MKKYDDIVVGSGISGLTLALLLGMNGHSVLLLEKSPRIGGSIARFYKNGIPFDTGFHFTGGFYKNGILHDMLTILDIHDFIKPIYLSREKNNRVVFEAEQAAYDLPTGYSDTIAKMKEYFPSEKSAIDRYFDMVKNVCLKTVAMDLRKISLSPNMLDEDYISLDTMLNKLTDNPKLKALMAGYSMCYGVKPKEISFANHSRVSYGLYESVARVKNGGDAFVTAFKKRFADFDVETMCDCYITECADIQNNIVGRLVLNTGEELSCDHLVFTIHPKEILKTLPQNHLSKAFVNRVKAFEPSVGLFSVYGVVEPDETLTDSAVEFGPSILSLFPMADINKLIDPENTGDQALAIMKNLEINGRKSYQVLNAFEVSFTEHLASWKDSVSGNRPSAYYDYKQQHIDRIRERIVGAYPEYKDSYKVVDAASPLTFRDYLNSPDGSAYGIKQKIGQFNLFGKLPLRNIYAAGQSAVLPGIVGAMMSSFIVGRSIVGKENYGRFLIERLGN